MQRRFYDCHTHLFPTDRMDGLMRWVHHAVLHFDVPIDITAEQAVTDLLDAGAVGLANLLFPLSPDEAPGLHAWGRQLADRFPEVVPFGGVHVDDQNPLGVVQEAVETYHMAGMKFHPMVQGFYPWHPRLAAVLSYLNSRGLPMYVHTGYDKWYGFEYDRVGLEDMLDRYPELPVVLSHVGFPDLEWGFALADRFPQVWLDLTNVPGSFDWSNSPSELVNMFQTGVGLFSDRVLLGTDYPAGIGTLDEIFTQLESIGLDDGVIEHVMVTSPERFFTRFGSRG